MSTLLPFRMRCPFVIIVIIAFFITDSARSQTLLERLRWERTQVLAREDARPLQGRMEPLPTDPLDVLSDSIRQWYNLMGREGVDAESRDDRAIEITAWNTVLKMEVPAYKTLFDTTKWSFLGSASMAELDTTQTRELRARLEHKFGKPTLTLAEIGPPSGLSRAEIIEFEYWFVLNDTIPVIVIDVNGPWDRGLVMASSHRYRERLSEIKNAFLGQLIAGEDRKPFADYYYNPEDQVWYVTGFDGASFFDVRIGRPNLELGRPILRDYISRSRRSRQ